MNNVSTQQIGVGRLAPHDLRRSFAEFARRGHAALEQIQLSLGQTQTMENFPVAGNSAVSKVNDR